MMRTKRFNLAEKAANKSADERRAKAVAEKELQEKIRYQVTEVGWTVTEENYDGEEDKIRINHSFKSEQDAIDGLVEKVEEHELSKQHDDRPSHLDDFDSGEGMDNDN